jgi:4-amino-4-deoxy-L-arabinose transferase-like glycosyltransferase
MKIISKKKLPIIIVTLLIFVGILFRLYHFSILPIDGHAMRQTDTESVAYNFAFKNSNILYPQNSLIRPVTNVKALFFLEFPAYEYLIGGMYALFGWHIELARLVNLVLFSIASFSLYYFVKKFINVKTAVLCVFFFGFIPSSLFFFGHALHPDIFAITTLILSLASYIKWKEKNNLFFFIFSLICISLSVATRPFIVIVLPAFLYLMWTRKASFYEYPLMLLSPFGIYGFWKIWQSRFKEADSTWENWVLDGRETLFQPEVLLRLIYKNVIGEVIGKSVFSLFIISIISFFRKINSIVLFLTLWLLTIPLYWLITPNGNIIHQYYANVFVIPIIITAAYGTCQLSEFIYKKSPILFYIFSILLSFLIVYNGIRTSLNYYRDIESDSHMKIAEEIQKVIPVNDKLVYLARLNSVPFSVYHRQGWMIGGFPVDASDNAESVLSMKQYGAKYIVEGKGNTDLNEEQLKIIKEKTMLYYSSQWVNIYKIQ